MSYIVRYRSDAQDRYEDVPSLDAALERSEELRNTQTASDVRIYREVKVEFKAVYKAEVVDEAAQGSNVTTAPSGEAASEPPPGSMPLSPARPVTHVSEDAVEQAAAPETAEARRTLFSRS